MKTTTKIQKAIFWLMAMSQWPTLPILPGIAGPTKRFSMTGHAQSFVHLMALKTRGAFSPKWFAFSLTLALSYLAPRGADACPPATPADFAMYPSVLRTIEPEPLIADPTACSGATNESQSPCGAHRVYVPDPNNPELQDNPRRQNQLYLFLPGTQSEPNKYDGVLSMAAYAGYKTIGLSYDNTKRLEDACAASCGCYGPARREVVGGGNPFFGVNSPAVAVQTGDTIVNRLYRLLTDLDVAYPSEGWGDFLNRDDNDWIPEFTDIDWDSIVVSGHSQGAGHALMITKADAVDGIFLFDGGNDDCKSGGRTYAQWHDLPDRTPDVRRSFNHDRNGLFALPDSFIVMEFGATATDFEILDLVWPTGFKVATTNQTPPSLAGPGGPPGACTDHGSMAYDTCMPDALVGSVAAASPADAYLFEFYVDWMCKVGD
jgi:hypothetical protein